MKRLAGFGGAFGRLAIYLATVFCVVMMFRSLMMEILARLTIPEQSLTP